MPAKAAAHVTEYVILQVQENVQTQPEDALVLRYVGTIAASGHTVAQRRAANEHGKDRGYVAVALSAWHHAAAEAFTPPDRVKLTPVELPPPSQTSILDQLGMGDPDPNPTGGLVAEAT